jgi:Fe-S-cluster-containing hydrogenase component 2
MEALTMDGSGVCDLMVERCIGCGLCVTTCPSGALSLHPKPRELQRVPPENTREQVVAMAKKRGVL